MDLSFTLNLEQKQQLIMTPQLKMALKLLQYSSLEVEQHIDNVLKENPLLEKIEQEEYVEGYDYSRDSSNHFNYENIVSKTESLIEHLEKQLYQILKSNELEIGKYIIGNLDEHGFLTLAHQEIAEYFNCDLEIIVNIIEKIQTLEPAGIATSNFQECLLIQLKMMGKKSWLAEEIVENYLQDVAREDYKLIAARLKVDSSDVQLAVDLIKSLNPHPAAGYYQGNDIKYIIPDLIINEVEGEFILTYNERVLPELKINQYYYHMLKANKDSKEFDYLLKKYKAACWLIRSIEQRRDTIFRIAQAIIKKQEGFFRKGIKYLKSMTMSDIAEEIDVHESTVSRATNEKYIQTPQGLFELKFFFNSGIDDISSPSIKVVIAELVNDEDISSPYSDRELVELLEEKLNINISRRTVAKYRTEIGLPSSNKRKRKK